MKWTRLAVVMIGLVGLSSCGIPGAVSRSAVQLPVRTVQSLGRTFGL